MRDEKEERFSMAREAAMRLMRQRVELVTTNLIFAETHAYFVRAPLRARQVIDDFEQNPVICCEQILPGDQRAATALLREHRDKGYSFCDAVSFVIMRRLNIRHVATFDNHFRQFGEFLIIP